MGVQIGSILNGSKSKNERLKIVAEEGLWVTESSHAWRLSADRVQNKSCR